MQLILSSSPLPLPRQPLGVQRGGKIRSWRHCLSKASYPSAIFSPEGVLWICLLTILFSHLCEQHFELSCSLLTQIRAQPLAACRALLLPQCLCLHQFICPSPAQSSQSCWYPLLLPVAVFLQAVIISDHTHAEVRRQSSKPSQSPGVLQVSAVTSQQDGPCASAGCRGELYCQYVSDESKKPPLAATKYCKPHMLTF